MGKQMLFVSSQKGFAVSAIINALSKDGYVVESSVPSMAAMGLGNMINEEVVVLYYIDDDVRQHSQSLTSLRDIIKNREKCRLYLVGSKDECDTVLKFIPKKIVTGMFLKPVNAKDIVARLASDAQRGSATGKRRILVVDDDGMALRTMNSILSSHYDVFMANSGVNAISFLAQNNVDLILLDYEMPVVSGLQVMEMLHSEENTKNIPVIFLTAKDDKDTVMKVLAAKPVRYLLKSMSADEILGSIDEFFL